MIAGQARFSAACAKLPTARAASNRNGNGRRRRIIFGNSMTAESVQGRRRPVTRGYLRSRGVYCVCGEAQCHLQPASLGRGIEIGRASCRERVGRYLWVSVVAVSFKKKK